MFQQTSCTTRVLDIPQDISDRENMEPHDCDENFTNFSISEILKPDFGRKHLTAGVLNLSRDKNTYEQTDTLSSVFSWSSRPLQQFGLKFGAFASQKCAYSKSEISRKSHNTNSNVSHQNKLYGLNLDVRNNTSVSNNQSDNEEIHNECRRRESCGGSDGESVKSSPATSPAGSPGSSPDSSGEGKNGSGKLWPAWVYCTRYSDRPSAGPRSRKISRKEKTVDEKRPRTAFTTEQLRKLKDEFEANKYLTETRRQQLALELNLNESQIKIWFQNKRAKIKKGSGERNGLALELIAQGLYNHKTVPVKLET